MVNQQKYENEELKTKLQNVSVDLESKFEAVIKQKNCDMANLEAKLQSVSLEKDQLSFQLQTVSMEKDQLSIEKNQFSYLWEQLMNAIQLQGVTNPMPAGSTGDIPNIGNETN